MKILKLLPIAVMASGLLASTACFKTSDTGEGDTDTDSDADGDTDSDADADADSDADYTSYEGWEQFDYGFGPGAGYSNCSLKWDASGTAVTPCSGCDWAFDVAMTYDAGSSTDDGTCSKLTGDASYMYGYTADYNGYGSYLMYGYGGAWYAWTAASFSGGNFTYEYGIEDYAPADYPGYYYTFLWSGAATVQ